MSTAALGGVVQEDPVSAAAVLVVEDDDMIRASAADIIKILGYRVLSAHSPAEALNLLREDDGIGVLFADLDASGIEGERLLHAARAARPDVKVIGASEAPSRHRGVDLVEKPYRAADLIRLFPPLPLGIAD